jgi:hypothetical protein
MVCFKHVAEENNLDVTAFAQHFKLGGLHCDEILLILEKTAVGVQSLILLLSGL